MKRNELIQLSKKAKLLKVNKLTRKKYETLLSFPYGEPGDKFYAYRYANGVVLRKNPIARMAYDALYTMIGAKRNYGKPAKRISIDNWFEGDYVRIIQEKPDEFILMDAEPMEVAVQTCDFRKAADRTGRVSRRNRISLAEFHDVLYAKKAVDIEVDLDRAFIRLTPVEESSLRFKKQVLRMKRLSYREGIRHYKMKMSKSHFQAHVYNLPQVFVDECGIEPDEVLDVKLDSDGSILIKGKDYICNATGERLNRYSDEIASLLVKESVATEVTAIWNNTAEKRNRTFGKKLQVFEKELKLANTEMNAKLS